MFRKIPQHKGVRFRTVEEIEKEKVEQFNPDKAIVNTSSTGARLFEKSYTRSGLTTVIMHGDPEVSEKPKTTPAVEAAYIEEIQKMQRERQGTLQTLKLLKQKNIMLCVWKEEQRLMEQLTADLAQTREEYKKFEELVGEVATAFKESEKQNLIHKKALEDVNETTQNLEQSFEQHVEQKQQEYEDIQKEIDKARQTLESKRKPPKGQPRTFCRAESMEAEDSTSTESKDERRRSNSAEGSSENAKGAVDSDESDDRDESKPVRSIPIPNRSGRGSEDEEEEEEQEDEKKAESESQEERDSSKDPSPSSKAQAKKGIGKAGSRASSRVPAAGQRPTNTKSPPPKAAQPKTPAKSVGMKRPAKAVPK